MGAVRRAVSSSEGVFEDDGAVAEYRLWKRPGNGNVVMEITHTFVPVDKRGCGLAGHVASAAFEFARQHDMRVLPTCTCTILGFVSVHNGFMWRRAQISGKRFLNETPSTGASASVSMTG